MASLETTIEWLKTKALALGTFKKYAHIWRNFIEFANKLKPLPKTWEDKITLYVVHLVEIGRAPSTIRGILSALKFQLHLDGYPLNLNDFLLSVMIKASHRMYLKKGQYTLRLLLSENILVKVLQAVQLLCKDQILLRALRAIFSLAYYGLFRIGELVESEHTVLSHNINVNQRSGSCRIILLTAKNQPVRVGPVIMNVKHHSCDLVNAGFEVLSQSQAKCQV